MGQRWHLSYFTISDCVQIILLQLDATSLARVSTTCKSLSGAASCRHHARLSLSLSRAQGTCLAASCAGLVEEVAQKNVTAHNAGNAEQATRWG
jgi:hypothetical protein